MEQPLCEMCLEKGIITPATDVHHIQEIGTYDDLERQLLLAFDYSNLMSLCDSCHMHLHGERHSKTFKSKNTQSQYENKRL